jgi:formamidopyrimidine-DNA glycosylase
VPELPDVALYIEHLEARVTGARLEEIRLASPFLLRSVTPTLATVRGRTVLGFRRLGKRIVFCLDGDLFLVLHLMVAGRLHWRRRGAKIGGKNALAALDFTSGSLVLTEAGSKRRASLHLVAGEAALGAHDPGGADLLAIDLDAFRGVLSRERHTLKRALTDPRLLSGIGNAYSDEILHRARLSPLRRTDQLGDTESRALFDAARSVLAEWTARLRAEAGDAFPEKVTAFRPGMAVHGRFRLPCPACGSAVQRIVYAETETNYCPVCQTGGRLLADRSLSRLLRDDWPQTLEELEERALRAGETRSAPAS